MSKTSKIVSTAMTKLGDAGAKAKKSWNKADLAKKAGALVSAGEIGRASCRERV